MCDYVTTQACPLHCSEHITDTFPSCTVLPAQCVIHPLFPEQLSILCPQCCLQQPLAASTECPAVCNQLMLLHKL